MPISRTLLDQSSSEGSGLSVTTNSVTPGSNHLILLGVLNWATTPGLNDLPTVSGCSLTWVQVATATYDGNRGRVTVFRAMGVSPTTGALTITFPTNSQTGVIYELSDYTGTDTTGTNGSGAIVQSNTGTQASGTSVSTTLSAFGSSNNYCVTATAHTANEAESPGTGLTNLVRDWFGTAQPLSMMWQDGANVTAPSASWTTTAPGAMVAFEVKAATAAPSGGSVAITGTAQVGQVLTATNSGWTNSPTSYQYTWQHADDSGFTTNVVSIQTDTLAGTTDTYTVAPADDTKYIRCQVVATNGSGSSSPANSSATAQVTYAAPVFTSNPTISGSPQVGATLTVTPGTTDPA